MKLPVRAMATAVVSVYTQRYDCHHPLPCLFACLLACLLACFSHAVLWAVMRDLSWVGVHATTLSSFGCAPRCDVDGCPLVVPQDQDQEQKINWAHVDFSKSSVRPVKRQLRWSLGVCVLLSLPVLVAIVFFGSTFAISHKAGGEITGDATSVLLLDQRMVRTLVGWDGALSAACACSLSLHVCVDAPFVVLPAC